MYLVVANLSNEEDINTAKYASLCSNKKPSIPLRYARLLTTKGSYDNAFVYELNRQSICLLESFYKIKEDN